MEERLILREEISDLLLRLDRDQLRRLYRVILMWLRE